MSAVSDLQKLVTFESHLTIPNTVDHDTSKLIITPYLGPVSVEDKVKISSLGKGFNQTLYFTEYSAYVIF